MDIEQYQSEAMRTKGDAFFPDHVDAKEMDAVLRQIWAWADLAERCKKSLFYGADAPQEELNELFRHDCYEMDYNAEYPSNQNLLAGLIGVIGESSELAELTEKTITGWDIDRERFIDEIGDMIWYIAVTLASLDSSLSEATTKNNQKLRERFPESFDPRLALAKGEPPD